MSLYSFTMKDARGEENLLADYQGKVLLIVNTASKCGLTPQYLNRNGNFVDRFEPTVKPETLSTLVENLLS